MKKVVIALLVSSFLSISASAMAQASYFGLNYLVTDFENKAENTSANLDGVLLLFGQKLHKNFAIEGRFGFGVGWENYNNQSVPVTNVDYRLNFLSGIYLRGELPLGKFRPYAMVGLSYVEVRVDGLVNGWPVYGYNSDGDWSYGAGLDFFITDSVGLNVDYMMMIDNSRRKVESMSGGLKFLL